MSLIKTGGGVAAISGKTGGTVYGRNKAGAYSRNWSKPVNPGTARQTDVRSSFAAGSAAFSMLDATQVASWNAYASGLTRKNRQGDSYKPTGRQIYIEQYSNMVAINQTPLTIPSEWSNVPAIDSLGDLQAESDSGNIDACTLLAGVYTIPSGVDPVIIVEAAPAHKASVTNVNTLFRQIIYGDGTDVTDLQLAYGAVFGTSFPIGNIFSIRVRVIDPSTGFGSTRMLANATIVSV